MKSWLIFLVCFSLIEVKIASLGGIEVSNVYQSFWSNDERLFSKSTIHLSVDKPSCFLCVT